jgi:hypothetical protein
VKWLCGWSATGGRCIRLHCKNAARCSGYDDAVELQDKAAAAAGHRPLLRLVAAPAPPAPARDSTRETVIAIAACLGFAVFVVAAALALAP